MFTVCTVHFVGFVIYWQGTKILQYTGKNMHFNINYIVSVPPFFKRIFFLDKGLLPKY